MVQGGMTCVKYLVFVFNLIFFFFGIALIAVGSVVQAKLTGYMDFFSEGVNGPAILLIVVGLIMFIISFFGCCGAIKENYCMVITFAILLILILVCEVSGAIAGFVYSGKIAELLENGMLDSMEQYKDNKEMQKTWNQTQSTLDCCGTLGYEDWEKLEYKTLPDSCCSKLDEQGVCEMDGKTREDGCLKKLKATLGDNVFLIGAVGISLAVIQVVGIVLACCLARAVRKEYDVA